MNRLTIPLRKMKQNIQLLRGTAENELCVNVNPVERPAVTLLVFSRISLSLASQGILDPATEVLEDTLYPRTDDRPRIAMSSRD